MNDSIKPGGSTGSNVPSSRLSSGAKAKEAPKKAEQRQPEKVVDSVVNEVGKARESVERITEAAPSRVEVTRQNESAANARLDDVDEAIRLSQDLELNIRRREDEAKAAHDINQGRAKDLLK